MKCKRNGKKKVCLLRAIQWRILSTDALMRVSIYYDTRNKERLFRTSGTNYNLNWRGSLTMNARMRAKRRMQYSCRFTNHGRCKMNRQIRIAARGSSNCVIIIIILT